MKTFQKVVAIILTGVSSLALSACHDDFDYGYAAPPVSVTPSSDSDAHYGAPRSTSHANYGPASDSDAHYGASAPLPPVRVTPNSNSGASYGN